MESTRSLRIVRMCGVPNILFYCCCADNIFPASAEKIRSGLSSCQLSFSHYPLYACRGQGNRFSIRALIRKLYFFYTKKDGLDHYFFILFFCRSRFSFQVLRRDCNSSASDDFLLRKRENKTGLSKVSKASHARSISYMQKPTRAD